jgi:hypothetical protein
MAAKGSMAASHENPIGACLLFVAGCELMPPYQMVDYRKAPDGKVILRDTPRTWNVLTESTDRAIQDEMTGKPPSGGFKTWNDLWVFSIRQKRDGSPENPEKYIAYIIERRRARGLPAIVLPPGKKPPAR